MTGSTREYVFNETGTIDTNGFDLDIDGAVSGDGGLEKAGNGTLTLNAVNSYAGGTVVRGGELVVGASGVVSHSESDFTVGDLPGEAGLLRIAGGTVENNWATLGNEAGATGTANMTGGSWTTNGNFFLGNLGAGSFDLSGGDVAVNFFTLYVGNEGTGLLSMSGGNLTTAQAVLGSEFGSSGNATVVGGRWINTGMLMVGDAGSGVLSISGNGVVEVGGTLSRGDGGSIALESGGTLQIGRGGATGALDTDLINNGQLVFDRTTDSLYSGSLGGSGILTKNGTGTLSLDADSSFSGATTINAGTLSVGGSISNSTVTVASGGILAGGGVVGDTTILRGGRIAPGDSPGAIDTGDLTLEAGGGYDWEIAAVSGTAGTDWDLIRVGGGAGNATISATPADKFTIFVVGNPTGWNPAVSYLWDIADWGIATGFDAGAFAVDTAGFTGAAPIGTWSLLDSGGFLKLGYFVGDPEWSGGSGNWSTGFVPPLTDGADITFTGPGGNSTNDIPSGTVSSVGAISFAAGAGAYILAANAGSAGFDSSTPLGLGGNVTNNSTATQTIRLALDIPGARTFQAATGNIVLEGDSSGAGSIVKTGGGSLLVGGDLLLGGDIEIQQGLLSLNGRTTAGNLTVGAGAMLGGTGPIEADVFNNGTVSPGNSIGTMTVAGDYAQSSASSLDIEIAGPGSFDRLVVSGQASLAGTLNIVPLGGNQLAFGEQYAFLDAGSIAGAFDTINMPAGFRGRFMENGSAGTLLVAPASYTQAAVTANQFAAAQALDSFISATGGDRMAVSMALDALTASEYPAAFEQTMPGIYENLAGFAFEQAFVQAQLLNQRFGSLRLGAGGFEAIGMRVQPIRNDIDGTPVGDFGLAAGEGMENWSAWVLGSGIFSNTTGSPDIPDSRNNAGGFLAGADHNWGGNFSTGLYAGYQYNDAEFDGGSSIIGNSVLFGGYAAFSHGDYFADAIVGGGYTGYRARRSIDFGTIDRIARAEPGGGLFTAAVNFGRDWRAGGFVFSPIAGAQYTYAGVGAFTEDGADSLDLAVGRQDANSLRSTLGGRIAYPWNAGNNLTLVPEVRMFWQHEFLDGARTINSSLDGGAGAAFGFDTGNPSRDSVFAGAGVGMRIGRTWNAGAFYNVDFGNPDFSSNIVSLSLGTSF
jgi:autotransporter-associated beta strand protein/T5SS/PEP-CTERM-associated repeat protein